MIFSSVSSAQLIFLVTSSSVSPSRWRRSEWPMRTHSHHPDNWAGETSPVNAPALFQKQFCAPSLIRLCAIASPIGQRCGNGGSKTTSTSSLSPRRERMSVARAMPWGTSVFIFQLPATNDRILSGSGDTLLLKYCDAGQGFALKKLQCSAPACAYETDVGLDANGINGRHQ